MMSNCTRVTGQSWSYRLLNVKLTIFLFNFKFDDRQHQNHPILFPHWLCNAQSFADHLSKSRNLKASPFRVIGVLKVTIIEKWIFRKILYVKKQFENFYVCILFEIGEDDDTTTCVISRGCCEVNGTAVKAVSGGPPPYSRKYDFLNIVKTNIPLRFKENIINFYFYYFICWLCDQIVKHTGKYR